MSNKRQFLVIKFEDYLVPLYIKLHPEHIDNGICTSYDEERKTYTLKFVTGRFDYKSSLCCNIIVEHDERFGQDHVTLVCRSEKTEWWHFEYLDENDEKVVWSRKYFSEVHGIKYSRD